MKLSDKYKRRLENYVQWCSVTTPFTGMPIMESAVMSVPSKHDASQTPEEWMFSFETYGRVSGGCSDPALLVKYKRGKAMRDWWFKETGTLDKLGSIIFPEELLVHLTPSCFHELFARWPITALVRQWHDNHYTEQEFKKDMRYRALGLEREQHGVRVVGSLPCDTDTRIPVELFNVEA